MQVWPQLVNLPQATLFAAFPIFALSSTMTGDLTPSSRVPEARCLAAAVGAHIMLVSPHPEDLQGFTRLGWWGTYIIHLPGVDQPSQWFLVLPLSQDEIQIKLEVVTNVRQK